MNFKKITISLIAIISIVLAIYGVWYWNQERASQPVRQEKEIR